MEKWGGGISLSSPSFHENPMNLSSAGFPEEQL